MLPGGPYSLWDIMINFQVFGLAQLMQMLALEEMALIRRRQNLEVLPSLPTPLGALQETEEERKRLSGLVQFAMHTCHQLEISAGVDRAERFLHALNQGIRFIDVEPEMRVLREAIEDGLRYIGFYHYSTANRQLLQKVDSDWQSAFDKFRSTKADAIAAVDCCVLGHNKASVYHSMQVLEKGLKVLASDVNENFTVQQWDQILGAIEGKIKGMQNNGIPGLSKEEKDARLQFLSEAAKEFRYFKDGWRNYVSHGHADYEDDDAERVLQHVREFMNHLATQLSETV
jgi:HEPN domain-containing protein